MKTNIYGFAFYPVRSLLYRLQQIDCCYLLYGHASINYYLEFLLHGQPPNILGLGLYTGIDQNQIRLEQQCSNKFRNDFINGDRLIIKEIKPFLKPSENVKLTSGIGNSWSNLVSWKIVNLIEKKT